jgi:hypothetical protein
VSDLSAADRAALRELLGGIHPDLLPLAVDQARSDFWTRYFVADANGLEFATVRNDDDVTADLIVRALNALPALLDAAEKVAEPESATGFKVTPILRANASIEAIELSRSWRNWRSNGAPRSRPGHGRRRPNPRRPTVADVLNAEQLDALPVGSQIIDRYSDVSTKSSDGLWHSFETAPMWSAKVAKWEPRLVREGSA